MDPTNIKKELPKLENYGKNVWEWTVDLKDFLELYDLIEPRQVYNWSIAAVESDLKEVIRRLKKRTGNEFHYPTLREIQKAVEEDLKITEGDKWTLLRNMKISEGETVKKFNYRYRKLYHNLSSDYQRLITVKEYMDSISSRIYPCSQVGMADLDNLKEAYEIAERAEKTEKEIKERNGQPEGTRRNNKNIHLMSQNNSTLLNHPIYSNLSNSEGNNQNFEGYHNYSPRYSPRRIGYNNFNYTKPKGTHSWYNATNPTPTNYGTPSNNRSYGNLNTYKNSTEQKKEVTIIDPKSNSATNSNDKNSIECFRCGQRGHKRSECPFSFKELAEMEEKGLLN